LKPVSSAPKAILDRITVAKQSIENDKQRALEQGRKYLPVFGPLGFTQDAIHIFERLACHPDMEGVWEKLNKVFDNGSRRRDTWAFANFCYQTMGAWKFSPRRTTAEHKHHFETIANDLRDVVHRIVTEPEFGMIGQMAATVSPLEMIENDTLEWLLEAIDADPTDGKIIKNQNDAVSYLRFCLGDVVPTLYEYSEWIAGEAERIAAQPSISDRPNRDSAQRTFFVRHLSRWFRERFDRPMHEAVAGVASALFDEVVTADTVRKVVRDQAEVSFPFRRGKVPLAK
jgi:hypothetical protein